ncbi:regulator of microtubule dynamics protein 1-like isoform X2 [Eriocheir sinensis]|uniref:regulator of microtubule dynamics protein 1-like isoform X2 n=1 Tax=Eriocheir sinensis TaxID=95602 RepID=UPI0021CAA1E6|nr:regulator of microtubule dynamics protein 1-like isoform X2 [Eriocheir sinensis]
MSGSKSFSVNINPKVAVVAALGTGIVIGAGVAYVYTRLHEHTHLVQQITNLHVSILEVLKKDLTRVQAGHEGPCTCGRCIGTRSPRFRKTVSFSSTTTTASYRTAPEPDSDGRGNDTDYFSPDEDDDEFFDLSADESDGAIVFGSPEDSGQVRLRTPARDEESGDPLSRLLEQTDSLTDGCQEEQRRAYNLLKNEENVYHQNAEFLWRLAKATRNMSCIEEKHGNSEGKKAYIFEAYDYAAQALELDEESAEVHKWYGILVGAKGEFLNVKERILNGTLFKVHIDKALEIKPKDSTLHHLLGRFCYEVAQLSWLERRVAAALFAEVPSSTYEEALDHFMAAEKLRPTGWKENRLFIAKCYILMNEFSLASAWLDQAASASNVTPDVGCARMSLCRKKY